MLIAAAARAQGSPRTTLISSPRFYTVAGSGNSTLVMTGIMFGFALIFGAAIYFGVQRGTPAAASVRSVVKTNASSDAMRAQLRDKPTMAACYHFRSCKPDAELVELMKRASKSGDKRTAEAAEYVLIQWGEN